MFEKSALASKTIQGSATSLAMAVALLVQAYSGQDAETTNEAILAAIAAAGSIYAIIGRLVAQGNIKGIFSK